MKASFRELKITTNRRMEIVDITREVEDATKGSGISDGICLVFSMHSTTAVIVNEHESGLMKDVQTKVSSEFPRGAGWTHDRVDDNADSHLASIFLGHSQVFPVRGGRIVRGTWQNIHLLELDGPRRRTILVECIGD